MFNQNDITKSLSNLIEIYSKQSHNIKLCMLSTSDICMTIMKRIQTAYEYEIDNNNLKYYGKDLFNQRACKLFEKLISSTTNKYTINQFWELWLLEDMTFAVVENINTVKRNLYSSDYRVIKTIVKNTDDIPFNPTEIIEELNEMCYDILEDRTIIYAM